MLYEDFDDAKRLKQFKVLLQDSSQDQEIKRKESR